MRIVSLNTFSVAWFRSALLGTVVWATLGMDVLNAQSTAIPGAAPILVSNARATVPVYNFAGIEPLLHATGDTVYVINFWATWCVPCVTELPYFEEARTVFKDQPVRIVLISLDFKKQIQSRLLPFLEKNHVASEVRVLEAPDANEWIDRVDPSWGGAIPATLVYRGNRRAFHEDAFTRDELIALVQSFLEPSP